jgi:hypothetical protein
MACIVLPSRLSLYQATGDWWSLARWIHDHLPYSRLTFYRRDGAFSIGWKDQPERVIWSYVRPHVGRIHSRKLTALPGGP